MAAAAGPARPARWAETAVRRGCSGAPPEPAAPVVARTPEPAALAGSAVPQDFSEQEALAARVAPAAPRPEAH
ncbi:hypothetical protein NJB1907f44_13500 [Mycobacterium marinum]|nr:hypothetical protein NJB1808e29_32540 [Mycobacterium marinum]GJO14237.1 hypothetical protein NJB1907E90_39200 [Mycobacterium marinum]GJO17875.1 hypothetical protein NJB1728e18_13710 [Mycobacterium marinum]GJO24830.1 hypothetical protein NJB1907E11_38760 [Mycobacterium marinum]GJO34457.1 hypothetical protein NJB1907f22_37470 [Mycobacterium marinum]